MNVSRAAFGTRRIGRVVAAVVVGFGVGTLLSPDPALLPVVGQTSGLAVGVAGIVLGGLLLAGTRRLGDASGCGCSGECGCS